MFPGGPGRCWEDHQCRQSVGVFSSPPAHHPSSSSGRSPWLSTSLPALSQFAVNQNRVCKQQNKKKSQSSSLENNSRLGELLFLQTVADHRHTPSEAGPEHSASAPAGPSSAWWLMPGCFHLDPVTALEGKGQQRWTRKKQFLEDS